MNSIVRWASVVSVPGFCLLAILLASRAGVRPPEPLPTPQAAMVPVPAPRTPAAVALRGARQFWTRAKPGEVQEIETVEGWDPKAADGVDLEAWRLQRLAHDPNGDLSRARAAANQGAALARSPEDSYAAAELRVLLAHAAGDRPEELKQARRLVLLRPRSQRAWMVLRRVETCRADPMDDCARQLAAIGRALATYRRDKGQWPAHLSELYPRYVSDRRLFHCPADPTPGSPGLQKLAPQELVPPPDPKLPVSYSYFLSPDGARVIFGALGPPSRGRDRSWRAQMLSMVPQFGDRVPVARCWHHTTARKAYTEPLVLNLTSSGQVYRSRGNWQIDPGTLPVVLARLEQDLAAGPRPFARRWAPGSLAQLFGHAEPLPGLRDRLSTAAARLTAFKGRVPAPRTDLSAAAGSFYYVAGDTPRAVAAYENVIQHLTPGPIYQLGEFTTAGRLPAIYDSAARHDKAIAVYQRLLIKDPARWDWMACLAREYSAMGRKDKAAEWQRRVVAARRRG